MENSKPFVLFGASGGAVKVAQTLNNLGLDFAFFVDNDKNKWGTKLEGKVVRSPECLREANYAIIIASDYQSEIESQLKDMGLLDQLVLKEELIFRYIEEQDEELKKVLAGVKQSNKEPELLIDLVEGIGLGGIETWAFMVASELQKRSRSVKVVSKITEDKPPKELTDSLIQINLDYRIYGESIISLVQLISERLPCVVLSNWQSQMMIAAIIVKRLYPDQVKIVSVLHNDKIAIYRRQKFLEQDTDVILCVSRTIRQHMLENFHIHPDKLKYKESPVEYDLNFQKTYSMRKGEPLKIGFAARIDKFQKRADLLVKLIEELERDQVNYYFEIAGKGSYYDKLSKFIEDHSLTGRVVLMGLVDRSEMPDFWKRQDVFLSVSDFEGASISMLEAMSYGVVPVVTEVSGVNEFVTHQKNGFCSPPGSIDGIKDGIVLLEQNRQLLRQYGDRCREIIQDKCKKDEYIDYIMQQCEL